MLDGFNQNASSFAADVDRAFWISTGISIFMFVLVAGLMIYFIIKYHHSRVKPEEIRNIKDHLLLEITWTVVPTILLFVIFYYGYTAFREIRTMPKNAMTIDVLGKRWSWTFTYPNGKKTLELYVPKGENIRLLLHAPTNDVLHSFYIPAFRVKEDVVPGRENHLWFNSNVLGRYDVECAEYCGAGHSKMLSKVEVLDKSVFDEWYASDKMSPHDKGVPKEKGEILYQTLGCAACHSLDGSKLIGPSFLGIFGKKEKVLTNGKLRELIIDETYIRDSVRTPSKDVVQGFDDGIMPNLSEQINKQQMEEIIEFIKKQNKPALQTIKKLDAVSIKKEPIKAKITKSADGATLFQTKGCKACHSLDGSKRVGPTLKGAYKRKEKVITDGKLREVIVDEAYLHKSIQNPNADVVEGYPKGTMPQFGKILTEQEIKMLVDYLKSVK